ncbi:putative methyltransferase-like protein 7A [Mercenaria mercenaria]|uniref:putative methyltransferase-like protein 7A n=1 Tax=Mercenaria mercenaria TaxID=6596 RepID=UPI001E1D8982|nr:putative methyltransferase-like protein 7A [Mercenaria mercenaria]
METEEIQCFSFYKTAFVFVVLGIIWYFREKIVYNSYKKYFAWILNKITENIKGGLKDEKTRLFQFLHEYKDQQKKNLTILEVGSGTAPNMSFYPANTKVVCLEPNQHFDSYAAENVKKEENSISVDFVHGYAEALPFENETFDIVVCTLVLCSVEDIKKCLQEIKRVLRQGGKYVFLEHVAYEDKKSWAWTFQCVMNPVHRVFFDGCETIRDTETYIMATGFSDVNVNRFPHKPFPIWFRPCISGLATK